MAGIVNMGLGLAAKFAIGLITGARNQTQASSVQLETQYGESLARSIILGRVGTSGHRIYRNPYSEGNRKIQDVLVLSHFRISAISRARFKGRWQNYTGAEDADTGKVLAGTSNLIRSKFYFGRLDQAANADLVARSEGRWTSNHRGAGVAYAYNHLKLDREKLSQPWEPFWDVTGPLLYDFRKDDTVGGDGDDRFDNQDSWSGPPENPVLQMYLLERGVYLNGQLICGKGVPPSRLPLDRWSVAANICDELLVGGLTRYKSGIIAGSGPGITHDQNMKPLLDACAGSWCEDATGEYPIIGALQSSVATVTDRDLAIDQDIRYSRYRTRTELVNTVSGKFQDPEQFFEPAQVEVRIDNDALAIDGETLAAAIPLSAVNDLKVADRLMDIAFRASRYQSSASIVLKPRFMYLKPGDWFTWQSDRYEFTKVFQVLTKRLGPFSPQGTRDVHLGIQEVGAGIFDPTAFETVLPIPLPPNEPVYATEAPGFAAAAISFENGEGQIIPALQFTWLAFEDPTVIGVEVEYRKVGEAESVFKVATVPQQVIRTADAVMSDTDMEYRHRLIVSPYRTTFPTDWTTIHTDEASAPTVSITLDSFQDDVDNLLLDMNRRLRMLDDMVQQVAGDTADAFGQESNLHTVAKKRGDAFAAVITQQTAAIEEIDGVVTANAEAIQLVASQIGPTGAEGLFRIRTEATSAGAQATIGISVSATENGVTQQAAILLDAMSGGESRVILKGDKVLIADEDGVVQAMFDATGTYIRNAFIQNLTADNIQAHSITGDTIAFNTLIGDHIVALSIDSPSLAFQAVTEFADLAYSFGRSFGGGTDNTRNLTNVLSVTVSNPAGNPFLQIVNLQTVLTVSGTAVVEANMRLLRNGTQINQANIPERNSGTAATTNVVTWYSAPIGDTTYDIETAWDIQTGGSSSATVSYSSSTGVLFWKR